MLKSIRPSGHDPNPPKLWAKISNSSSLVAHGDIKAVNTHLKHVDMFSCSLKYYKTESCRVKGKHLYGLLILWGLFYFWHLLMCLLPLKYIFINMEHFFAQIHKHILFIYPVTDEHLDLCLKSRIPKASLIGIYWWPQTGHVSVQIWTQNCLDISYARIYLIWKGWVVFSKRLFQNSPAKGTHNSSCPACLPMLHILKFTFLSVLFIDKGVG